MRAMGRKIIRVSRAERTMKGQVVNIRQTTSKGGGRKVEKTRRYLIQTSHTLTTVRPSYGALRGGQRAVAWQQIAQVLLVLVPMFRSSL